MLELSNLGREAGLAHIRSQVASFTGWGDRLQVKLQGEYLELYVTDATPEQASHRLTKDQYLLSMNVGSHYVRTGGAHHCGLDLMDRIKIREWYDSLQE